MRERLYIPTISGDHRLVFVHSRASTLPLSARHWNDLARGMRFRGQAIGILQRILYAAPDRGGSFHIAPGHRKQDKDKWFIYIGR